MNRLLPSLLAAFGLLSTAAIAAPATTATAPAPVPAPAAAPKPAPAPAGPTVAAFDTFQSIGSLNIFNASRVGPSQGGPQPQVETIAFVGTMDSEKGMLAFFDSSNRTYRTAVAKGAAIAEFKVTQIETNKIELTRDSKTVSLNMGQQLRRPPGGDWAVGPASRIDTSTSSPTTTAIPEGASDTLRKMMEARQKSLKQ